MTPSMPMVGEDFAGYRLLSVLGRGGMSVVFEAENPRLGSVVALKVIAPELAANDLFRARFLQESRTAASLNHPNVIPIYDAGPCDELLYIAMRHVSGRDLRSVLKSQGHIAPAEALMLIGQAGRALDAAHRAGLVHRDVKPANILIERAADDEPNHVYLADFGITKHALSRSGLTATGQFVGTIDYIAPEQIQGKNVDGRADIYSLGCVLYECLTGRVPFLKDLDAAVIWAHVEELPTAPSAVRPELPRAIDEVIARALAKDPSDRYASANEFMIAARAALGEPSQSSASTPAPQSTPEIGQTVLSGATLPPAPVPVSVPAESVPAASVAAASVTPPSAPPPASTPPMPVAEDSGPGSEVREPRGAGPTVPPPAASPPTAAPTPTPTAAPTPTASEPPYEPPVYEPPFREPPAGSGAGAPTPPFQPAGQGPSDGSSRRNVLLGALAAVVVVGAAVGVLVSKGGSSTPPGKLSDAALAQVPTNHVTGSGQVSVRLNANSAAITITTEGLDKDEELAHLIHIHAGGKGECPPASAARLHNGHLAISTTDGINYYGPPVQALTTHGDTSVASILVFSRFPSGGKIRYTRTITLPPKIAEEIRANNAVIVIHGTDYDGTGIYSGVLDRSELSKSVPGTATAPALCGRLTAAQTAAAPNRHPRSRTVTYTASLRPSVATAIVTTQGVFLCHPPEAASSVADRPRRAGVSASADSQATA